MSNFQHPFNDSLKKISDRLDILLRKQSFKERQDPNYVILDNADILQHS